jgi:hypothetical protein
VGSTPERWSILAPDLHARAEHVTPVRRVGRHGRLTRNCTNKPQANPVILVANVVDEQPHRSAGIAHDNVRITVVVDVSEGGASTDFRKLECCTTA